MSHTHTSLLFHIVFSTDGHLPLIKRDVRTELFPYMASLIKEKKGKPIIINGVDDHVHLLISLPPDISISDAMRFVKANSSRWMKKRFGNPSNGRRASARSRFPVRIWTLSQNTLRIRRSITKNAISRPSSYHCSTRTAPNTIPNIYGRDMPPSPDGSDLSFRLTHGLHRVVRREVPRVRSTGIRPENPARHLDIGGGKQANNISQTCDIKTQSAGHDEHGCVVVLGIHARN